MERRNQFDRRSGSVERERAFPCNRRRRPDRRLSNIRVEWIPIDLGDKNPLMRFLLGLQKYPYFRADPRDRRQRNPNLS